MSEKRNAPDGGRQMRPRIICHMVSSIDGRLLVDRWSAPAAGIDADVQQRHYEDVAAQFEADGWIVGRKTMEHFATGRPRTPQQHPGDLRTTHVGDRRGRNVAIAIDPKGKLHYGQDHIDDDHIVAVLGEQVSDDYLAELRADGVSYLFAGANGGDLRRALAVLHETFDLKLLLLEGGGIINGAFLKEQLIDEISLLVHPAIDGLSGVPSIFEYVGSGGEQPAAGQSLRHLSTKTLDGGTVWLRYRVEKTT